MRDLASLAMLDLDTPVIIVMLGFLGMCYLADVMMYHFDSKRGCVVCYIPRNVQLNLSRMAMTLLLSTLFSKLALQVLSKSS